MENNVPQAPTTTPDPTNPESLDRYLEELETYMDAVDGYLHKYAHVDGWQEQLMMESDRYA